MPNMGRKPAAIAACALVAGLVIAGGLPGYGDAARSGSAVSPASNVVRDGDRPFAPNGSAGAFRVAQIEPNGDDDQKQKELNAFEQYLVGVWQGTLVQGQIATDIETRFDANRTYRSIRTLRINKAIVEVWGKWAAAEFNGKEGTLSIEPEDWRPHEFCRFKDSCDPYFFPSQVAKMIMVNKDSANLGGTVFRRKR